MRIRLALFLFVLIASSARSEDWRREVDSLRPVGTSAGEAGMLDDLERRAREALEAIPRAGTAADADRIRGSMRRRLEASLGLGRLPWPPNLRPRLVGTLRRDGYRIEKVIYQALPGSSIPAHLYIPEGLTGLAPAVVFYPGHWWPDSKTRPDFQAFCINMARLGFVVLTFDPFGQGERGISSRDHRRTEALLVGVAQQGFAEYETRCAIEFLLSRPEVDPKRVGITGASGGGYNTWITSALDDRIAAAVPVVGTSEFLEQIRVCRPLDWYHAAEHCHYIPGLIRSANNHEFLAMSAPKPALVLAASQDQSFPLGGVREVAQYGRTLYASYGAPERFGLVVDDQEGHGYQRAKREAAYGWFLRWLSGRGDGKPYAEPPTETVPFDAEELRCFPPGENRPAGPAMIEAVRRMARDLPPSTPRIDLERVFGLTPKLAPARVVISDARVQRLSIPSEPGLTVPAFLIKPDGDTRGVLVALDDRGKEAIASDPITRDTLARGWAVCGIDPRGIGESATDKKGWVYAVSLLLGENFVGRQAFDIGRVLEALAAPDAFPGKAFALAARGHDSSLAATYAIAADSARRRPRLHWYLLRDGFLSYRSFIERPRSSRESYRLMPEDRDRTTAFDREIPAAYFVFDALRSFDLPQLLASSRADGLIVNPLDGDWGRLPEPEARRMLPARVGLVCNDRPDVRLDAFLEGALDHAEPVPQDEVSRPRPEPVRPDRTIALFNGKDLTGLTTWLKDTRRDDPRRVFRVEDGILRITGDGFGYIATNQVYRDYRVVVEYKWGTRTDGGKFVRNSGLLLHATGPDGGAGGTWMASIECQLAQGCVGDLIPIPGQKADGSENPVRFTSEVVLGPDKRPRWTRGGQPRVFDRSQLWWSRHDPDFKEFLDTRGRHDLESPLGEWTRVECVCDGGRITVLVNGQTVNECYDAAQAAGKILLQSEGFEIFVRRFELHPLRR